METRMQIDFKITTWERFTIPEELESEVKAMLESGEITNGYQLADYLEDKGLHYSIEMLTYVDTYLAPKENKGYSTIEVWEENEVTFKNGR